MNIQFGRVHQRDQELYQTERYEYNKFSYSLPVPGEGRYVLVLMFSEVYFNSRGKKIFNVELEGKEVVSQLDVFGEVGKGVAHRELVPLTVSKGRLELEGGRSVPLPKGELTLSFVKGAADNPKVNAFYLMAGSLEDVPELPEPEEQDPSATFSEETIPLPRSPPPAQVLSGPRTPSPYTGDAASFLPLLAAVGAAVPLIICLCR